MKTKNSADRFPFNAVKKVKNLAILCHRNADPDSYLSAYAISRLVKTIAPKCVVHIIAPGGVTSIVKKLMEYFHQTLLEASDVDYGLYIAVDVGHTELLNEWADRLRSSKAMKILIDHHPLQGDSIYDIKIVNTTATSTAEVVHSLYKESKVKMLSKVSQALLTAILFDSQHLAIANENTLRTVLELIKKGAKLEKARLMLRSIPEYGEVIAKLKGAQRLKIYKAGKWVFAVTSIGSFQAHVARALLGLGAELSVASGRVNNETRISLRSTARFYNETKLHLGITIAGRVAKMFGGYGGGHPTAASLTCKDDEQIVVSKCLDAISDQLKVEISEVK